MAGTDFFLSVPGLGTTVVQSNAVSVKSAINNVLQSHIDSAEYYVVSNGRTSSESDVIKAMHTYHVFFRMPGGKGGFGSMLRSIGAQIEKTTNREACRDLSGRRMRDVNNEKQLREWVSKAEERERAKEERRKERRERMKAPKYKFDDPEYEQQRAAAADMLDDALQKGLENSSASGKGKGKGKGKSKAPKRKHESDDEDESDDDIDLKKAKEWLGVDIPADSSSSSSDSDTGSSSCLNPVLISDRTSSPSASSSSQSAGCTTVSSEDTTSQSNAENKAETNEGGVSSAAKCAGSAEPSAEAGGDGTGSSSAPAPDNLEPQRSAQEVGETLELDCYASPQELETLGLEVLKVALMTRGIKCGGTLQERAQRLFSIRGLQPNEIPAALKAKPTKQK